MDAVWRRLSWAPVKLSLAARSIASPLRRVESEAASSSRAWSSKLSRSARTRSNLKLKGGRVTAGSIVSVRPVSIKIRQMFDFVLGLVRRPFVVESLDAQRPLSVDEDQPAGAEMTAVHEQVCRRVRLAVEVEDRALRHADNGRCGHPRAA